MDKSVKLWIQSQNNLIEQLELQITNSTNVILMEKKILNHTKQTLLHEKKLLTDFLNHLENADSQANN
jgi:hypothetical protein